MVILAFSSTTMLALAPAAMVTSAGTVRSDEISTFPKTVTVFSKAFAIWAKAFSKVVM